VLPDGSASIVPAAVCTRRREKLNASQPVLSPVMTANLMVPFVASGASAAGDKTRMAWFTAGSYEIEIAGERIPAQASLRPFYDPTSERTRS
jgi:hypothetical protein